MATTISAQPTSSGIKPAETYPFFCPRCGKHREVEVLSLIDKNDGAAEKPIPYCTKCDFRWNRIKNPEKALKEALIDLNDFDLINILRQITQSQKGLYATISRQLGKDAGYVQRVFEGSKHSADILKALLTEIRSRLGSKLGV